MSGRPVLERRRRAGTLVLRPVDALREALRRPPHERGPVAPVRPRLDAVLVSGVPAPLPAGAPRPVRNAQGDTVYRDLRLPAGTYRLALERDARDTRDSYYEELLAGERELAWAPDAPPPGLPDGTPHSSTLVELRLRPAANYPFPGGSTLLRGGLFWYHGAPVAGAVVHEAGALLPESRVDARGGFALAFRPAAATGSVLLDLLTAGVAPADQDAADYLAQWPAQWPATWRRGVAVALRQPALAGAVRDAAGRPLPGATVTLPGRPGAVATDRDGRWRYVFPPDTPAGTVDVKVAYPGLSDVQLNAVAIAAGATQQAPAVHMQ